MENIIIDFVDSSSENKEFNIHSIEIKPFNEDLKANTGFYIELRFEVYAWCVNYSRFYKHTSQDFDTEFYLDLDTNTNVFTFKEAVTYTPTTTGVLQELEDLKDGNLNENYRFVTSSYLYRCIQTLANFWD